MHDERGNVVFSCIYNMYAQLCARKFAYFHVCCPVGLMCALFQVHTRFPYWRFAFAGVQQAKPNNVPTYTVFFLSPRIVVSALLSIVIVSAFCASATRQAFICTSDFGKIADSRIMKICTTMRKYTPSGSART